MDFKLTLEEMISKLDTACGMLLVASMKNKEVFEAKELIMAVSLALGEVEDLRYFNYEDEDEDNQTTLDDLEEAYNKDRDKEIEKWMKG